MSARRKPRAVSAAQLALELAPKPHAAIVRRSTDALARRGSTAVERSERSTTERLSHWASIIKLPVEQTRDLSLVRDLKGRPRSVWSAIRMMSDADWHRMALDGFGLTRERDRRSLIADSVLFEARETDRVDVVRRGGKVVRWDAWIDPAGRFKVSVFP